MRIAIIGWGFVGKAVEIGFRPIKNRDNNQIVIVDPKYRDNKIEDLGEDFDPNFVFVCVPTPMKEDGNIDASILLKTCEDLTKYTPNAKVIIKSTVTPDIIDEICKNDNFVYNPEFLTERNYAEDFLNPPFQILGGKADALSAVSELYRFHSNVAISPELRMTVKEASLVKYGINSFLATKVVWFNEFKDLVDNLGANYITIANAMVRDNRIGYSHMIVPGPDGKRGFGGACFPKDTQALLKYASDKEIDLSVLNKAVEKNKLYREAYDLDDREKEQNIKYG
jgi:UDPglucose 6-dehydrogenase